MDKSIKCPSLFLVCSKTIWEPEVIGGHWFRFQEKYTGKIVKSTVRGEPLKYGT